MRPPVVTWGGGGKKLQPLIKCMITEVKAGEPTSLRIKKSAPADGDGVLMTSSPPPGRGLLTGTEVLLWPVEFEHFRGE